MTNELLIISGVSGSGKSVALNALEDAGFYCIDNLPVFLLEHLGQELDKSREKVAISLDVRNLSNSAEPIKQLLLKQKSYYDICKLVYLDCDENILLNRYTETRRKHPLSDAYTTLREAIIKERVLMETLADFADLTINTSKYNSHELHARINQQLSEADSPNSLMVVITSFGFKHGVPSEADFVFDVRCLPNPYWQDSLRRFTGLDSEVQEFLLQQNSVCDLIDDISTFFDKWLSVFSKGDRSYVSIAIGCTGGRHRSVFIAEKLGACISSSFENVIIKHREIKR